MLLLSGGCVFQGIASMVNGYFQGVTVLFGGVVTLRGSLLSLQGVLD